MSGRDDYRAGPTGPPPGAPVDELRFELGDLPRVRHLAAERARGLGLGEEAVGDLVIAVNEVATNAVTHGTAVARFRTWTDGADLVVEIHDSGTWKPGPRPGAVGGMGLWVASRMATDLSVRSGDGGSTVVLRFLGKL